jgi:tetratricopeptide (TPR) repeat protein
MLQTCPACHSDNRDIAKFCDQCGAALSPSVAAEGQASPPASDLVAAAAASMAVTQAPAAAIQPKQPATINWSALLVLGAIVLGIVWVIKMPSGGQPAAPPMVPAAGGAGGNDPIGTMQNVQAQLADLKGKLKKDPTDTGALHDLYTMYSQIGQTDKMQPYIDAASSRWQKKLKRDPLDVESLSNLYLVAHMTDQTDSVRPYVDTALATWKQKYPKPNDDSRKILAGIALAALQAEDDDEAAKVLIAYHEADPTNLGVMATLGNLYYNINEPHEAIQWYDMYLAKATPKEQPTDYWNILVDKATMHLNLAGTDIKSPEYATAMQLLLRATKEAPKHWAAWYNLGQAYKTAAQKEMALAAFKQSQSVASDEESKY